MMAFCGVCMYLVEGMYVCNIYSTQPSPTSFARIREIDSRSHVDYMYVCTYVGTSEDSGKATGSVCGLVGWKSRYGTSTWRMLPHFFLKRCCGCGLDWIVGMLISAIYSSFPDHEIDDEDEISDFGSEEQHVEGCGLWRGFAGEVEV